MPPRPRDPATDPIPLSDRRVGPVLGPVTASQPIPAVSFAIWTGRLSCSWSREAWAGSTNTAVLETVGVSAPEGVAAMLYGGMGDLPHFNPDDDREGDAVHGAVAELRAHVAAADAVHGAVAELRAHVAASDALLICPPESAGALPGALKN